MRHLYFLANHVIAHREVVIVQHVPQVRDGVQRLHPLQIKMRPSRFMDARHFVHILPHSPRRNLQRPIGQVLHGRIGRKTVGFNATLLQQLHERGRPAWRCVSHACVEDDISRVSFTAPSEAIEMNVVGVPPLQAGDPFRYHNTSACCVSCLHRLASPHRFFQIFGIAVTENDNVSLGEPFPSDFGNQYQVGRSECHNAGMPGDLMQAGQRSIAFTNQDDDTLHALHINRNRLAEAIKHTTDGTIGDEILVAATAHFAGEDGLQALYFFTNTPNRHQQCLHADDLDGAILAVNLLICSDSQAIGLHTFALQVWVPIALQGLRAIPHELRVLCRRGACLCFLDLSPLPTPSILGVTLSTLGVGEILAVGWRVPSGVNGVPK